MASNPVKTPYLKRKAGPEKVRNAHLVKRVQIEPDAHAEPATISGYLTEWRERQRKAARSDA